MLKNRFIVVIGVLSLLLVAMAVSQRITVDTNLEEAERMDQSWEADPAHWEAMGQYYANQATAEFYPSLKEPQLYIMDSATRSYIAQGMAILAERNKIDSATQSYIAWGKALEAAAKLGESGTCSNMTQENIFAGIPDNLDSATRSYIAQGLALRAKNEVGALCP